MGGAGALRAPDPVCFLKPRRFILFQHIDAFCLMSFYCFCKHILDNIFGENPAIYWNVLCESFCFMYFKYRRFLIDCVPVMFLLSYIKRRRQSSCFTFEVQVTKADA